MTEPAPARRYRVAHELADAGRQAANAQSGRRFGLGRHVNHDPRSKRFAFQPRRATLRQVEYLRRIPIFDQGDLGACTGMTGIGVLGTEPYFSALMDVAKDDGWRVPYEMSEAGAVRLYGHATEIDPFEGRYPPTDTGSDGLSVAKVLHGKGVVPGYQHTFSLNDALLALQSYPLMVGTLWTDAMFYPNRYGIVAPAGAVVGGHEYIADEFVPAGGRLAAGGFTAPSPMVGFTTSWSEEFGVGGRFYMTVLNFEKLLHEDGDVIVLSPPTAPAPLPSDPQMDDADEVLAAAFRTWMQGKGL